MRKLIIILFAGLTLVGLTGFCLQGKASALSGSQFKAGRIIDDQIFYSPNSMNASQIQSFLNSKVPVCDTNGAKPYGNTTRKAYSASKGVSTPFICLKNYKQNTPSRGSESGLCSAMSATTNRTAANIINDVAKACGVSPKVILVLLQKEQSLVTDDWPWPIQYRSATGYGCPDTAPCDSEYYGFFNQVYNAARQFKRYRASPTLFNNRAGRNNSIQYSPVSSCGSKSVFIQNQATAGLYNYTPYTPNAAALKNLYGTGDSCSSYGNRNFWRMFHDWFGSTTRNVTTSLITGDWNGDGIDSIAVKVDNKYMFENNITNNDFSSTITWGNNSDQVFVGDWDGDGKDDIGLKRGNEYFLYGKSTIVWGNNSDQVFVGDWDGDGKDDIGLKRGNEYFLYGKSTIVWGNNSDQVFVGDWDHDSKDDIGLKRGNEYFLYGSATITWGNKSDQVIVGDWDGNGSDELGLKRGTQYYLYGSATIDWGDSSDQVFVGDWNNDGKDSLGLNRFYTVYLMPNTSSPGTYTTNTYSIY